MGPLVGCDGGRNRGARYGRRAHGDGAVPLDKEHVQRDIPAFGHIEALDEYFIALAHAILFSAGADDGVHTGLSGS